MALRIHTRITDGALSLDSLSGAVRHPRAGAVVVFQGVTRAVERLEYEAYVAMAEERIRAIAGDVAAKHELCALAIEHRIGSVPLSEPSVVVAASAPHRPEAFLGAREAIDRVKAEAPIWKREFDDGTGRWVEGTPVAIPDAAV
jgi:MoaE-MoaD fusion protein